jgi:hypothetical protein
MKEKQKNTVEVSSPYSLCREISEAKKTFILGKVAGVTGYVFAALKEFFSYYSGTYVEGVVSPFASLDPTPGLVNPSMQAKGNRISPCFNQIPCFTPATYSISRYVLSYSDHAITIFKKFFHLITAYILQSIPILKIGFSSTEKK